MAGRISRYSILVLVDIGPSVLESRVLAMWMRAVGSVGSVTLACSMIAGWFELSGSLFQLKSVVFGRSGCRISVSGSVMFNSIVSNEFCNATRT